MASTNWQTKTFLTTSDKCNSLTTKTYFKITKTKLEFTTCCVIQFYSFFKIFT